MSTPWKPQDRQHDKVTLLFPIRNESEREKHSVPYQKNETTRILEGLTKNRWDPGEIKGIKKGTET